MRDRQQVLDLSRYANPNGHKKGGGETGKQTKPGKDTNRRTDKWQSRNGN